MPRFSQEFDSPIPLQIIAPRLVRIASPGSFLLCPSGAIGRRDSLKRSEVPVRVGGRVPKFCAFSKMDITRRYERRSGSSILSERTRYGRVGEWFKPAVLKTADSQGSVSSNLTVSAKEFKGLEQSRPFFLVPTIGPPAPRNTRLQTFRSTLFN